MSVNDMISEAAHFILLPPMGLFLWITAGALLQRRWPRAGKAVNVSGWVLLVVFSTEIGARLLVQPLEAHTSPLISSSGTNAQAIVALAAGRIGNAPEYGGKDVPDYVALARLRYAAKLQHETGLPVLVSGGSNSQDNSIESKAQGMARALQEDFKVPVAWVEAKSRTTAENATFSAAILKRAGVKRILLVTDAMHMARAERVFRLAGLEVVAAPTVFLGSDRLGPADLLPSAEGLRRSYYAVYEWLGLGWYRLREMVE